MAEFEPLTGGAGEMKKIDDKYTGNGRSGYGLDATHEYEFESAGVIVAMSWSENGVAAGDTSYDFPILYSGGGGSKGEYSFGVKTVNEAGTASVSANGNYGGNSVYDSHVFISIAYEVA